MAIQPKHFLYALDAPSGIATITLNRPERLNALTFEVYSELTDTFERLDQEPGVKAVVITGAGRAFCTGGDVEHIIGGLFGKTDRELLNFTRLTCRLILSIRKCKRPVVAALNGVTAGAGAAIAAASDFRIASDTAKIAFLFTKVGLSGADMGVCWLLPRIVGLGKATEILMLGDFVEAKEAERIGLYHKVVSVDKVVAEARALAERLAKGPSDGLAVTKDYLNREASMSLEDALEEEAKVQALCMKSPNFREAHAAFMAKRAPRFV